ncbi:MAG TPA: class I SAM-dependent rRNA methyltransferase [Elusimicrobiota bacterium]|jgi:23S rRNA (cytosine1962-C5)-methyltransferase|nr:class I SAM-dependent rRNA methyltransferase [Elusimicrobiota bacterium]
MEAAKRAPAGHGMEYPWVRLRSAASGNNLYKRMIAEVDDKARAGDVVMVYDKSDAPFGLALYNPRSLISLRLISRGKPDKNLEELLGERVDRAVELRRGVLGLDASANAYRLIHDQGDGFPGLTADRYGDWIVLEFYTLGMFHQAARLERLFKKHFPEARFIHRASSHTEKMEGFRVKPQPEAQVRIEENGVLFEANLAAGYKTGFFCDQRDNRLAFSRLTKGRSVLDVCAYTGGFGLYAKKLGGAGEVTCVELDPEACARIEKNSKLNSAPVEAVTVDAFPYMRQAQANKRRWGAVVLDPYKLIASRETYGEGRGKYIDLNRLALGLVEPGGVFVTCSCSGMLQWDEFQQILRTAAGSAQRRVQILRKSGAGGDHPFAADHPEGEYLKVIWCRVA